jgi:putative PIN family toxin of toxin-antitoxin system
MPRAVLDSTVLVSAFLTQKQLSAELLRHASRGAFVLCLSPAILGETQRVLLESHHIRDRYEYQDEKVYDYVQGLRALARLVSDLPAIKRISRDPEDDMVIACALASDAEFLVTRDKDLLSLRSHEGVTITTPEDFMALLRKPPHKVSG